MQTEITLTRHTLTHIPRLGVDENIFSAMFREDCSIGNCNAHCCSKGVFVDIAERDRILQYTDLIRRHMQPTQQHDPSHWFDPEDHKDHDFPSGRAIGTQVHNDACVFLMSHGRCVLHAAAAAELPKHTDLKPFFCFAFPITIIHGVVMVDQPEFVNRPNCCTSVTGGTRHALDVCREELIFVLGREGFEELQDRSRGG